MNRTSSTAAASWERYERSLAPSSAVSSYLWRRVAMTWYYLSFRRCWISRVVIVTLARWHIPWIRRFHCWKVSSAVIEEPFSWKTCFAWYASWGSRSQCTLLSLGVAPVRSITEDSPDDGIWCVVARGVTGSAGGLTAGVLARVNSGMK